MVDSLHNLISAQGDSVIENLNFAELSKPTASYVIDRRSGAQLLSEHRVRGARSNR